MSARPTAARTVALVATVVATLATGCGGDYSDLLAVRRTGWLPDARLTFVINAGGTVRCGEGPARSLPPRLLLDARDIVRELRPAMEAGRSYPRPPGALLRYEVETVDGEMAFSDVDGARDPDLGRLIALVRETAQRSCGAAR